MIVKFTNKMIDLQDIVAFECHCPWDLFLENVEGEGYTPERFAAMVEECKDRAALRRLVSRFV